MLGNSNVLAIVGTEKAKEHRFKNTSVCLYDIVQETEIAEIKFKSLVIGAKFSGKNRLVVSLKEEVFIFSFDRMALKLLQKYPTFNPDGILAVSNNVQPSFSEKSRSYNKTVIVFPNKDKPGYVNVVIERSLFDENTNRRRIRFESKIIHAHNTRLRCLGLNSNGSLLATASEKGTLVRIFDTRTAVKKQSLRRGTDLAKIHSMCFRKDSKFLSVTSDKRSIHVFWVNLKKEKTKNRTGLFLGGVREGEWSFAWYQHEKDNRNIFPPSIVHFFDASHVVAINTEGQVYKIRFDEISGKKGKLNSYNEIFKFKR